MRMLLKKEKMYAYVYEGRRHDTGDKLGFLKATVEFALKREDLGASVPRIPKGIEAVIVTMLVWGYSCGDGRIRPSSERSERPATEPRQNSSASSTSLPLPAPTSLYAPQAS